MIFVRVPGAAALARRLNAPPRCTHYRWRLDEHGVRRWDRMLARRRGRVLPCLCDAADQPHPDCPHVTWQSVAVVRLPDGTLALGVEDPARYGETRFAAVVPRRELDDGDEVWSAREETRAARRAARAERAAPAERSRP